MNLENNVYVFIGPPGSGKGSISHLCVQALGWIQLSTGNLCRKHIIAKTEIGKEIAFAINSGKLVPDSLITSMVEEWMIEQFEKDSTIVLDGYPRSVAQAQALTKFLAKQDGIHNLIVVEFYLSDEKLVARLTDRLVCQNSDCQAVYSSSKGGLLNSKNYMVCDRCASPLGQREDDKAEAVCERLIIYHKHKKDLLDFYENSGVSVLKLNADAPLNSVFAEFMNLVGLRAL